MLADEARKWLFQKPFQPFKITLKDGTVREIPLRIVAQISATEILVYDRSDDPIADVTGPPTYYDLDSIVKIESMEYEPSEHDRVV